MSVANHVGRKVLTGVLGNSRADNRIRNVRTIAIIGVLRTLFILVCSAHVVDVTLDKLISDSDRIVVVNFVSIEPNIDMKAGADKTEEEPVRFATARVMEVWKGSRNRDVRFVSSPSFACDISVAEPGEAVVLFLQKDAMGVMHITHLGRGRMPIVDRNGKSYANFANEVTMPKSASTIVKHEVNQPLKSFKDLRSARRKTIERDGTKSPQFVFHFSLQLDELRELVCSIVAQNKK